jgi:hypothetical protein
MASRINKLSGVVLSRLIRPGLYGDGGGLWLQVSGTTARSWVFHYAIRGKRHQMGLGSINTIDLATARVKARGCRQLLLDGQDPLAERHAANVSHALREAKRITFDQCAAAYIDAHRGTWKNPKHVIQWENTIATYASPLIGSLAVADIETDLIVKVLSPIWRTTTETAVRLRGRLECILDWATVSKFRSVMLTKAWRDFPLNPASHHFWPGSASRRQPAPSNGSLAPSLASAARKAYRPDRVLPGVRPVQ